MYEDNIIDDRIGPCRHCIFYNEDRFGTCKAFPDGIPSKYALWVEPHFHIDKNQKGDYMFTLH